MGCSQAVWTSRTPVGPRSLSGGLTVRQFPFRTMHWIMLCSVKCCITAMTPMALIKECQRVARRGIFVFEDMPEGPLGRSILFVHVWLFARYHRYPFMPASIGAYRAALGWLGDTAACVARIPQPPEWFTVYPRVLFVYELSESVTP